MAENDPIHRPAHYANSQIEVANFIADRELDYFLGCVVKYVSRAGKKDPSKELEDLQKAQAYLGMKIRLLQGELAVPERPDHIFNGTKVAPAVPKFLDGGIEVPDVLGVRYLLYMPSSYSDLEQFMELEYTNTSVAVELTPGAALVPGGMKVVIVAEPTAGYRFPTNVVRAWEYESRTPGANE